MQDLLNFAEGHLFRFCAAIGVLGLIRALILAVWNGFEAKQKGRDKSIPSDYIKKLSLGYSLPIMAFKNRPLFASLSIVFHIGLLAAPLLLLDHWRMLINSAGLTLDVPAFPKIAIDVLTLLTISVALILFFYRVFNNAAMTISRKQDFLLPLLLAIPFISGFLCSNIMISPQTYKVSMLFHVLSGDLILFILPFTKLSHSVLLPLSQWIAARSWNFPPSAAENVRITLNRENEKL